MQQRHVVTKVASAQVLYSRLTLYYSSKLDIHWQRSVHYCPVCDVPELKQLQLTCGAIHYGWCTPPPFPSKSTFACESPQKNTNASLPKQQIPKEKDCKEDSEGERGRVRDGQSVTPRPASSLVTSSIQTVGPSPPSPHSSTVCATASSAGHVGTSTSTTATSSSATTTTSTATNTTGTSTTSTNTAAGGVSSFPQIASTSTNTAVSSAGAPPPPTSLSAAALPRTVAAVAKSSKPSHKQQHPSKPSQVPNTVIMSIPQFYFPTGRPMPVEEVEAVLQNVAAVFAKAEGGKIYKNNMAVIVKALNFPLYWKSMLFRCAGGEKLGYVTFSMFSSMWRKICQTCHDDASKFVRLLAKPGCKYLVVEDFVYFVQDVVDTHPGLSFLQEAKEFHSRYVHTVISRIFFCVNRSWSGKITPNELRRSHFLQTLLLLEEEDDINQITDYFSYEHFYVIYCKFWELDQDHDLYIDRSDLARHNDHAMSSRIVDRIFSGAVTRGEAQKEGKMSYPEFVWFLIAEEDKRHPTSIEYWFRCMDIDGDGVLSIYEMEYFYEEQMHKMEALGIEKLQFEDCLCQMLDLVCPEVPEKITLHDLKSCKMSDVFYDTFFNLDKFLDHEQRDPFTNLRDPETDGPEMTDWEKYAAEEYENLLAEVGVNEDINYEDDFEPDDEDSIQEELVSPGSEFLRQRSSMPRTTSNICDPYYFRNGDLHF
ncbi:serine/threonine-protein phosphatase 2A regulatory subunit B subunit beta-like isoform X3 [Octopus vulgaris]|uniref:Serine/threonine-protein phosphatase 2A regulatory subunit B subunit beta-like isoform X3 n=1 Tax=Octopus vulgaris TaxID=6645 RepID=A0AA36BV43_OCTVU|nr:serine/threonine-protein phosphatase 2A regulatory subunit B subunit beta-like isoform X3 [Octopus vulgaris]